MTEKKTKKKKKIKYREVLNYDMRKLKRSVVIGNEDIEAGYSKESNVE